MADRWTPDEDALLRDIYLNNSKETILSRLNKGWRTICRRARRLDLHRNVLLVNEDKKIRGPRKDTYTEPELELIRQIYAHNRKEYILSRFSEAGYDRSWQSIRLNAKNMGIHRDPEIVKQEMIELGTIGSTQNRDDIWSDEENALLKEIYPHGRQQDIVDKFPKRNWKSIREHCIRLGLSRDKSVVNLDYAQHLMENHGVTSTFQLPGAKEASRQTNLEKRGVEYPTQCPEVREKIRKTVQEKYGVDSIFQVEEIKSQVKKTNIDRYGVENPNQSPEIRTKIAETNQERYGISNPFQMVDRVQEGMMKKYGYNNPLKVPEILARVRKTNTERYGTPYPSQNPEVRKKISQAHLSSSVKLKKYRAMIKHGSFNKSDKETNFFPYIKQIYPDAECSKLHPAIKHVFDYYLPTVDLWGQYDGWYWHSDPGDKEGPQAAVRRYIISKDEFENAAVPNLIRFKEKEMDAAIKTNTISSLITKMINDKLQELKDVPICHQYRKKMQYFDEDVKILPFNPETLKAGQFDLLSEPLTLEIREFIERYEWLGTIGVPPKWCFTARFKGILAGVVLINEPIKYSKILGEDTPKYEALIQRGASISWAPKNLGSRLIMFACRWMVQNTTKRAFIGYADPSAHERGTIYTACGFDFLGDDFGSGFLLRHNSIDRMFTAQYLYRTSTFKKWCYNNHVQTDKTWFKDNGFKNLEIIPGQVKTEWYTWARKIISESEQLPIPHKRKYVLVLGKNRREKFHLSKLKQYSLQPYPEYEIKTVTTTPVIKPPSKMASKDYQPGITHDRKNSAKISFLVSNYGKLNKSELATAMNESERWVKRQLSLLTKQGKITRISPNKPKDELLSEETWPLDAKNRAISLRTDYLKTTYEITEILKKEFNLTLTVGALNFWFGKFNCPFPSKEEWLKKFLPYNKAKQLLDNKMRFIDIRAHLKEEMNVNISDDLIGKYLHSINL